jgi:hypothetical protein
MQFRYGGEVRFIFKKFRKGVLYRVRLRYYQTACQSFSAGWFCFFRGNPPVDVLPCLPPAGFAFSQKFPEAPEVLFFMKPEFLVQMSPVFCRIMFHPVHRYSERVGHDYRGYFRTGFWSLWLAAGISKTTSHSARDTCSFPEYAGF